MFPFILVPYSVIEQAELDVLNSVFDGRVSTNVEDIPTGSLVFTRYRTLPFAKELEEMIVSRGSELVNSYHQHRNIANIYNWVTLLDGYTAPAYHLEDMWRLPEGEFFVKGETNSKKNDWFRSCYAPNKATLTEVVRNVQSDMYLANQEIVIRPFRNYRKVGDHVDGRPVFNERRMFILDGSIMSEAFYWSSWSAEYGEPKILNKEAYNKTVHEVIDIVKGLARFIVVDFAEFPDGSWEVVELNDGNMSGLSDNDPEVLWTNVRNYLTGV